MKCSGGNYRHFHSVSKGGGGSGEITLPPSAGEKFGKFLGESPAQLKKKNTDSMLFVILKFGGGVEKRLI